MYVCVCASVCVIMMCSLLVLDSVTSTPQWIRQPRPRVYLKEGKYVPYEAV
jgi:hypothetical protein